MPLPDTRPDAMTFEGSLADLQLTDLVQLFVVGAKTGQLRLTNGASRGEIHLVEGRIVHARAGERHGEEAVYALALLSDGHFEFLPDIAAPETNVSKGNNALLMEVAKRLDEWRLVSKKVPSTAHVPELVPRPKREGRIALTPAEWLVLSQIDGRRSVSAIATRVELSELDAAKVLFGLVSGGLVHLRNGSRAPRPDREAGPTLTPEHKALRRLARVREVCTRALGSSGEAVVRQHIDRARQEIERGSGPAAMWEAVDQIVRAASVLKGKPTGDALLEQLSSLE